MCDLLPYEVLQHGDYIEVRLQGVLEAALNFDDAQLGSSPRLLIDYADVTEIRADAFVLAEQARKGEARGLKVAVYAPRPALFGLNRQAFQLSDIREGVSAGVFTDREAARTWLLSG